MKTLHPLAQRTSARAPVRPLLRWSALCLILCTCTLAVARDHNEAREVAAEPGAGASDPAAGQGAGAALLNTWGSLLSKAKSLLPEASPDQPSNSSHAAPQGLASGQATPAPPPAPVAFNIIDIDSWSKTSVVVLDPQCSTMVQPFGLSDNLASLAILAAKLKVNSYLSQFDPPGTAPVPGGDKNTIIRIVKLAARNLNWLPMEAELAIGKSMLSDSDIVDEGKNKDTRRAYAEARAVLAGIVGELPAPLPYDFQVKILTASNGNASALPGGIILVDRDLFNKGADRDVAHFKMAHEVAHVLQRHQTRAYQAKLMDGLDSLQGFQNLVTSTKEPNLTTLLAFGTTLKKNLVNFSEAQEMQADSCAVRLLGKSSGNAQALAGKLRKLDKLLGPAVAEVVEGPQDQSLQAQFKYLGDGITERHPNTNKRRGNLHVAYAAAIAPAKLAQAPGQAIKSK